MQLTSILESILFVHGEPVTLEKLAKVSKHTPDEVAAALAQLKTEYRDRGFALLEKNQTYQIGSNPSNAPYVEDLVKGEFSEELSRAAIETVAIIAYKGPLTRAELEFVRGVNSSFTLRNLLLRGLVERAENPKDARSYIYRVSFDFLKHFGITAPEELPQYREFREQKIEIWQEKPSKDHA